jgi:hypothetical protein
MMSSARLATAMRGALEAGRETVIVVVPAHKPRLDECERIALAQCARVLHRHPIAIVAPRALDTRAHEALVPGARVVRFDDDFFAGVAGYNRLMLSPRFYAAFWRYRHMLVHQLDAFVFSDQLEAWCARDYDYVGAPWIECAWLGPFLARSRRPHAANAAVGNGGLSLRRVTSCFASSVAFRRGARRWPHHEDLFWSFYVPRWNPWFRIPPVEEALGFAFETEPATCFARTGGVLPFGCHAWERYDAPFWRPFIEQAANAP